MNDPEDLNISVQTPKEYALRHSCQALEMAPFFNFSRCLVDDAAWEVALDIHVLEAATVRAGRIVVLPLRVLQDSFQVLHRSRHEPQVLVFSQGRVYLAFFGVPSALRYFFGFASSFGAQSMQQSRYCWP